jgi:hypothetical protein
MAEGRESIKNRGASIKQPSFLLLNEPPRLAYPNTSRMMLIAEVRGVAPRTRISQIQSVQS